MAVIPDSIFAAAAFDLDAYLDTTASAIVTADTVEYEITGLEPGTVYQIYGRTVCGGEEGNSDWTNFPTKVRTKYYYKDNYFFGFEKEEGWERSQYSTSDNYIMHPAIETGYVQLGSAITSYSYMPHGMVSTTANSNYGYGPGDWSLGKVGVRWNATASYYGQYMILPAVDSAANHSFEFKFRNGYTSKKGDSLVISTPSNISIEIGTVDKFKGMETYKKLATVSMEKLPTDVALTAANDWLWRSYTLDLDSATIADKQIVFFQAEKPSASNYPYIDNVALGAPKGFGLVSIDKVMAEATSATVTWDNLDGPWNLYVLKANGDTLKEPSTLLRIRKSSVRRVCRWRQMPTASSSGTSMIRPRPSRTTSSPVQHRIQLTSSRLASPPVQPIPVRSPMVTSGSGNRRVTTISPRWVTRLTLITTVRSVTATVTVRSVFTRQAPMYRRRLRPGLHCRSSTVTSIR